MPVHRNSRPGSRKRPPQCAGQPAPIVRLHLRARQLIAIDAGDEDTLYLVERGCVTLSARLPDGERHVMLVLYPGDMVSRAFTPPLPEARLGAAMPSVLVRTRFDDIGASPASGAPRLLARAALHAAAIGRLSGEERLATLLVEIALHLGHSAPGGYTFELPLSRSEMADYLGLNPDTLSRLMSRLRARGLIAMPTRDRVIARDFEAFLALSPLAVTLQRMCSPAATADREESVPD